MKSTTRFFIHISLLFFFNRINAQNQCLDTNFGNAGISTLSFGIDTVQPKSFALQTDQKIIVAGKIIDAFGNDILISRFLNNGLLDSTFGINGIFRTDVLNNSIDYAQKILIQNDGKLLVGGYIQDTSSFKIVLIDIQIMVI